MRFWYGGQVGANAKKKKKFSHLGLSQQLINLKAKIYITNSAIHAILCKRMNLLLWQSYLMTGLAGCQKVQRATAIHRIADAFCQQFSACSSTFQSRDSGQKVAVLQEKDPI